jgi:nuclear transport factor 2 (NTF2) superfamily protein
MSEIDNQIKHKCVAKSSLVYTSDGMVKIEDIVKNKHKKYDILTLDKDYNTIYKPIKHIWETGKQQTYELKTENGSCIKLTN